MPILLILGVLAFGFNVFHKAHAYPTANEGIVERPQSVPEPASLAILGTGVALVLARRRRK